MRPVDKAVVLDRMRLEGFEGRAYVLGCRENRVTVRDQQVRALNLAYAMDDLDGVDLAVVGGGVAGMSFAAAAAARGAKVTLYERDGALARLLARAGARPLEPFLFEWPRAGWEREEAGLPLLSWRSGSAKEVVSGLRDRFLRLSGLLDFQPTFGVSVARIARVAGGVQVFLPDASPIHERVVLAVGFGIERGLEDFGADAVSYWAPSPNEAPSYLRGGRRDVPREVLISGCGDGGLADFLMVRLRDHGARLMRELIRVEHAGMQALQEAVIAIEDGEVPEGVSAERYLLDAYLRLEEEHAEVTEILDARIRANLDETTIAALCQNAESPLRFQAFRINRLLAFRVLRIDGMQIDGEGACVGGFIQGYSAPLGDLSEGAEVGGRAFESCIPRHGPEPELEQLLPLSTPHTRRSPTEEDPTRFPLWAGNDMDEDARRSSLVDTLVDSAEAGFLGQTGALMTWCAANAGAVKWAEHRLTDDEKAVWNTSILGWADEVARRGLPDRALRSLIRDVIFERSWSPELLARGLLLAFEHCVARRPRGGRPSLWHVHALQSSMGDRRQLRPSEALPAFALAEFCPIDQTEHLTRAPAKELLDQFPVSLEWVSSLREISGIVNRAEGVSEEELRSFRQTNPRGALVLSEWSEAPSNTAALDGAHGVFVLGAEVEGDQVWTRLQIGGRPYRQAKFTRCGHEREPNSLPSDPALRLFMSTATSVLVMTCSDLWQETDVQRIIEALRPAWVLVPACERTSVRRLEVIADALASRQGVAVVATHPSRSVVVTEWLDETERI